MSICLNLEILTYSSYYTMSNLNAVSKAFIKTYVLTGLFRNYHMTRTTLLAQVSKVLFLAACFIHAPMRPALKTW